MRFLALGACVALAACGGVATGPAQNTPSGLRLVPDTQGLAIEGSTQRIDFGRSPKGVVPVLDRELGSHRDLGTSSCPVAVVRQLEWNGLTLTFTDEQFVGWRTETAQFGQVCA